MKRRTNGSEFEEYARMRGLDKESVRLAVHDGRLSESVTKKGSRYDIDPDIADQEWKANTNPAKQNNTKTKSLQRHRWRKRGNRSGDVRRTTDTT